MTDELGVDRIFARGTTPADVASYLVHAGSTGAADRQRGDCIAMAPGHDGPAGRHHRHAPPLYAVLARALRR